MKKLFVAVAAVMVVSATAFSTNNKMTNNGVDEPDTVVVDSSKAFALVDDTVTSDTVVAAEESAFALALADDTVTSDTVMTVDETAFALAFADDTVTSDTVITDTEKFALAKNDAKVEPDTTTTEKEKVEEVIEKVENKIGFMA